jgi:hypothetical protein
LAAPIELAPALVGTAFPVPYEDCDDRSRGYAHSSRLTHVLTRRQRIFGNHQCLCGDKYGGESGIRTHVTLSSKHAFQACAFSHSAISPAEIWEGRQLFQGYRSLQVGVNSRPLSFIHSMGRGARAQIGEEETRRRTQYRSKQCRTKRENVKRVFPKQLDRAKTDSKSTDSRKLSGNWK